MAVVTVEKWENALKFPISVCVTTNKHGMCKL